METIAIKQLRNEALAAGDTAQADICAAALAGDAESIAECERVAADRSAQEDTAS